MVPSIGQGNTIVSGMRSIRKGIYYKQNIIVLALHTIEARVEGRKTNREVIQNRTEAMNVALKESLGVKPVLKRSQTSL